MSSEKSRLLKKIKGSSHILHPESTLVFKSAKDRIVIGRYDNETIVELDNKTVKLCEKWNYKYDTSLNIKEVSDNEVEEGTEEEEEATEEEETKEDDEVVSNEVVSNEVVSNEVVSDEVVSNEVVSDEVVSDEVVSNEVVSNEVVSNEVVSNEVVSTKFLNSQSSKNSNLSLDNLIRFSTGFNTLYDEMKQEILVNETSYINSITSLRNELDIKTKENDNITEQYNKLKQKFEGIKSLFNV